LKVKDTGEARPDGRHKMFPVSLDEVASAIGGSLSGIPGGTVVVRVSTDSRDIKPGDLYIALLGERFDGHDFCVDAVGKGGVAVVIQEGKLPGIEIPCVRVPDTLWALGELARHVREMSKARVVGITGSVGKTSTKEFLRSALGRTRKTRATEGNYNNLVGLPKTLLEVDPKDEMIVLEMGTDQMGEIKRLTEIARPEVGVVTSVAEAHLNKLGTVENVLKEKSELLKGLPSDGLAVIPADSPYREELVANSNAPSVTFGTERGSDFFAADPTLRTQGCYGFTLETPVGKAEVNLQVPGLHQVEAATAAAAVAVSVGLDLSDVIEGLQSFTGLPGRCELINLNQGITVIADHYNANPVSMAAGQRLLETFLERRRVFVAGEMWDLGTKSSELHRLVGDRIGSGAIDLLVAIGPQTRHLVQGAKAAGLSHKQITWFGSTEEALPELATVLKAGDVVLVKGSRGMQFEKALDALIRHFGRESNEGGVC